MRPVSDPGCMAIFRNDCNASEVSLRGPVFSRWDMRLNKRFPVGRRINIELTFEVLNVFDTINFNHSVTWSTDPASAFRVGSAYTEINTTFDPGGRIGQLAWRINW